PRLGPETACSPHGALRPRRAAIGSRIGRGSPEAAKAAIRCGLEAYARLRWVEIRCSERGAAHERAGERKGSAAAGELQAARAVCAHDLAVARWRGCQSRGRGARG